MALISCPECGKEVSDRAPACIHCGYPLSSAHRMRTSAPSQGPTALPSASPPAPPIRMPAAERSAPS